MHVRTYIHIWTTNTPWVKKQKNQKKTAFFSQLIHYTIIEHNLPFNEFHIFSISKMQLQTTCILQHGNHWGLNVLKATNWNWIINHQWGIHGYHSETPTPPVMTNQSMWCLYVSVINSLWPGDAIWWHGTRSTLAQVMACCRMAPRHYLNQCWLIIVEFPWHSSQGIILRNGRRL